MSYPYSPDAEAVSSRPICSDGKQSVQSKSNRILAPYLHNDSGTDSLKTSPSGVWTSESSTQESLRCIEEWLTLLQRDSLANHSALREGEEVQTTNGICGPQQSSRFAWYDRDSHCWRTSQESLPGITETTSEPFSETFPKQGTMRNGWCSERMTAVRRIEGNGCGFWPTPDASAGIGYNQSASPGARKRPLLGSAVKYPTLRASDGEKGGPNQTEHGRPALASLAHGGLPILPTPSAATMAKNARPLNETVTNGAGGQLNPYWVEWLMFWPIGWTSTEEINHECFRCWREAAGSEAARDEVQSLWWGSDPANPPQGQEPHEQLHREPGDALSGVPHRDSCPFRRLGEGTGSSPTMFCLRCNLPAEQETEGCTVRESEMHGGMGKAMCRVAVGTKNRINRLRAIGNGQVPIVATRAWTILYNRMMDEGSVKE